MYIFAVKHHYVNSLFSIHTHRWITRQRAAGHRQIKTPHPVVGPQTEREDDKWHIHVSQVMFCNFVVSLSPFVALWSLCIIFGHFPIVCGHFVSFWSFCMSFWWLFNYLWSFFFVYLWFLHASYWSFCVFQLSSQARRVIQRPRGPLTCRTCALQSCSVIHPCAHTDLLRFLENITHHLVFFVVKMNQ